MTAQYGLICSITDQPANFTETCPDFNKDQEEESTLLVRNLAASGDGQSGDHMNFEKNKSNGRLKFLTGIVLTIISHSVTEFTGIFMLFYATIFYGAMQYLRGVDQEKVFREHLKKKERMESNRTI